MQKSLLYVEGCQGVGMRLLRSFMLLLGCCKLVVPRYNMGSSFNVSRAIFYNVFIEHCSLFLLLSHVSTFLHSVDLLLSFSFIWQESNRVREVTGEDR